MGFNGKLIEYRIQDHAKILEFITGGKAIFTIQNEEKKTRFTYKFKQTKKNNKLFWVYMLCMSNNESGKSYKFIGGFSIEKGFINSPKSSIRGTTGIKAIEWFCRKLLQNKLPNELGFYHQSRCARCGKMLTTPESIKTGFGPECVKYTTTFEEIENKIEEIIQNNSIIENEHDYIDRFEDINVVKTKPKKTIWSQLTFNFFAKKD